MLAGLNRIASVLSPAVCILALTVLALALMGSTVTMCGAGCFAADLSHMGSHAIRHSQPTWSADGTRIAFYHYHDIYVVAADGSSLKRAAKRDSGLDWFGSPFSPDISPDGSRVAYVQNSDSCKANFDIFVSDIDGSHRQRLTEHAATDTWPVWSPDGTRLAFLSDRDSPGHDFGFGAYAYFTMNADGSDIQRVSGPESPLERVSPAWSPDSTKLAFVARIAEEKSVPYGQEFSEEKSIPNARTPLPTVHNPHNTVDYVVQRHVIYTVGADGSDLDRVWDGTTKPGFTPRLRESHSHISVPEESVGRLRWSPDGTRIAFDSRVYGGPGALNVLELDGSETLQLASPRDDEQSWFTPLFWSSDSSTLTFVFHSQWIEGVRYMDHAGIYVASSDGHDARLISQHEMLWQRDWNAFHSSFAAHQDRAALNIPHNKPNAPTGEVLITVALDGSDPTLLVRGSGNNLKAVKRD